jgi:hypothetical protein
MFGITLFLLSQGYMDSFPGELDFFFNDLVLLCFASPQ